MKHRGNAWGWGAGEKELPLAVQCGAPAAWCGGMDTEGKSQQDVVWAVGLAQELVFATALRKYSLRCLDVATAGAAHEASTVQLGTLSLPPEVSGLTHNMCKDSLLPPSPLG